MSKRALKSVAVCENVVHMRAEAEARSPYLKWASGYKTGICTTTIWIPQATVAQVDRVLGQRGRRRPEFLSSNLKSSVL